MRRRRGCLQRLASWLVCGYFFAAAVAFLVALFHLLRGCLRRERPIAHAPTEAATVPAWAYRQPDPLIYSQQWLLSQGLAVTWHNPDIHLELPSAPGVPVDSWSLAPDTVYRVKARVWNGSPDAPVAGLPVEVSYLDFGIGGVAVPIATTTVDLPVKGAPGTPAIATVDWHTPATPGHYCLQVRLLWPHDANPDNNLGQHNVDVQPLNSPRATFAVPVRNTARGPVDVRLLVDAYELTALPPCDRERRTVADHAPERHPLPRGWSVSFGRTEGRFRLEPGGTEELTVEVVAPDGFSGRQAVNVNGLVGGRLLGGVTLIAEGDADG